MIEAAVYVGSVQVGAVKVEAVPQNGDWLRLGAAVYQVHSVAWVSFDGRDAHTPILGVLRVESNSPFIARVGLLQPDVEGKPRNRRS